MTSARISRRFLLKRAAALGLLAAVDRLLPSYAWARAPHSAAQLSPLSGDLIDLIIAEAPFHLDGRTGMAMTINGTVPGPVIRLKEGQQATMRVTNRLQEDTSIHWHGILLPPDMDGVPGVSYAGIKPGSTFTYRFPITQSGTYWFHSHSGGQELRGMYAPLIIDPLEPEPFRYERDYVIMLSDWSFELPEGLFDKLKKQSNYYNFQKRTAGEFLTDVKRMGLWTAIQNYLMWDQMRMDPTDFADVTANTFTYLMNGRTPAGNWTGLFRPGERVRLRFIAAASMTMYDVRIPGLKMTVVQVDGQNIQPVAVDEFRIGVAETYDVIVEPTEDRAYTIFAETMDRSGYARGTLAVRAGMTGEIPDRRPRPLRTMEDMGMSMEGMTSSHGGMKIPGMDPSGSMPMMSPSGDASAGKHLHHNPGTPPMQGMHEIQDTSAGDHRHVTPPAIEPVKHGPDDHGPGNQTVAEYSQSRMGEPGRGLGGSDRRVLLYTDLKSLAPYPDQREPEREIELHLTGHMERYMWSFDGKKYSESREPIHFRYGERLRLTFLNDTMMEHPLHLHGMWMHLENGAGEYLPRKHTVIVKPAERLSVVVSADAPGRWAFHCHLLFHMEAGMFRVVEVSA
ncbi:MAG: copper resistance system multicopper oxidase [Nitrospirota bacterium]|nr:copper resistance system multicopper oxidase [Nitrospirota bacterium]MDP2382271.1 copper resistance system multicopper oxidase [Nitrospirota bacterium]